MKLLIDLQNPCGAKDIPYRTEIKQWLDCAVQQCGFQGNQAEVTIRIVDETEMFQLNSQYRGKSKPTNVLSFPFEQVAPIKSDFLGDIVICHSVVKSEAEQQNKQVQQHWAHLTIHGFLHLIGYDHISDIQAEEMESLEILVMQALSYQNPYLIK
ncbi:MAG: rRNA maturation RNase YbeY [Gammaproteobacteria bacterium]|nr:rRNA maturation RNase YbeY [Gammaproteobacteria bacterium]MDH5628921.1 rRNA maturation RNase YbeY [Gammaproteobacteria bacterium]